MIKLIDLLLIAVIIISAWSGYKKGMIMGIGSIIVIIVSVYGANLLSNAFSYEVIPAIRPFADGFIEKKIDEEVLAVMGWEDSDYSINNLLEQNPDSVHEFCAESFKAVGIHQKTAETLATETVAYAEQNSTDIPTAIVEVLCSRISYAIGFLLAFLLIVIILTVIGNIPNLSFRIPNMDRLNDIGGAAAGLVTGLMFCFVIVWALKFTGLVLGPEVFTKNPIARLFLRIDLLSRFIGL